MCSSHRVFLESVCIVDQILEICVLFSTILKVIRSEATSVFLYISCTLYAILHDKWCLKILARLLEFVMVLLLHLIWRQFQYVYFIMSSWHSIHFFCQTCLLYNFCMLGLKLVLFLLYFIVPRRWLFLEIYEWKWW